ncbi:MAG: M1 family metallopeptidase [Gammaproteobacteria bacterium]|nr:M1 family metallopeptidase [Gammaproteobacteria bacterium]MDH3750561.1 M1 family metallopeptidase [Gammaproteobacteria bacterium]MDH3805477.1 M1 family metallopeptidase [Gammaproteobacteria bacterium]
MHRKIVFLIVTSLTTFACTQRETPAPIDDSSLARDYFTFADTDRFVTDHLDLNLTVNFESEQLHGSATLTMRRIDPDAAEIVLDTRDLTIENASFSSNSGESVGADFRLGQTHDVMGTPLIVSIPPALHTEPDIVLTLQYRTSPQATALQWLPPELTAGGEHPFLFSQSQAIHARSWVPLQDTPAVRITYNATIRTPPELLAVMSANNDPGAERDGIYEFEMPQRIPSYLLALAVGNIYFAPIGEQTGVYSEPETLEASAFEFADTQTMLETAETMFGPYQWGRYDLLILPPSFPFGGMENPRLSFLTPSLLAGDRSLVAVVAHELAHSWSGNLVTNATWRDGWLNEGWTSYLESRLMEVIYSKERAAEENVLGYRELLLDFEVVNPVLQALAPPFETGDPDDFQGTIHYHKGNLFLQYLENAVGREAFDEFIGRYFNDFAFGTITSEVFLDYLDEKLLSLPESKVNRAQAEQWLYKPGLPDDALIPSSDTLDQAAAMAVTWSSGEIDITDIPVSDWSPQAMMHFINSLDADLSTEKLGELDVALGFSDTRNAEIGRTWFIQVAQRQYRPAYEKLEQHLRRYGRTRLVRPVYKALAENGSDLELAREMFARARSMYHPLTIASIELVFKRAEENDG